MIGDISLKKYFGGSNVTNVSKQWFKFGKFMKACLELYVYFTENEIHNFNSDSTTVLCVINNMYNIKRQRSRKTTINLFCKSFLKSKFWVGITTNLKKTKKYI